MFQRNKMSFFLNYLRHQRDVNSTQKGKVNKMITYRGAILRNSDVHALKIGSYIELLGFTSTSLS